MFFDDLLSTANSTTSRPPIDPLIVVQTVRSHITNQSWKPVPVEYNSGLLRLFEDYRRIREAIEGVSGQYRVMIEGYRSAEQSWIMEEGHYQEEIRRLELMIARGATGMSGVIEARQGSVVKRKQRHRKTSSTSQNESRLTADQLDEEIKLRSQKGTPR